MHFLECAGSACIQFLLYEEAFPRGSPRLRVLKCVPVWSSPQAPEEESGAGEEGAQGVPARMRESWRLSPAFAPGLAGHHHSALLVYFGRPGCFGRSEAVPSGGSSARLTALPGAWRPVPQVYQLGGICKLVSLLRSPNQNVQQAAAGALRNLVFRSTTNKLETQRQSGIREAVSLLRRTSCTEIQKQLTGGEPGHREWGVWEALGRP